MSDAFGVSSRGQGSSQHESKLPRKSHGICRRGWRVLDVVFGASEGNRLETVEGHQYHRAADRLLFGQVPGAFEGAMPDQGRRWILDRSCGT